MPKTADKPNIEKIVDAAMNDRAHEQIKREMQENTGTLVEIYSDVEQLVDAGYTPEEASWVAAEMCKDRKLFGLAVAFTQSGSVTTPEGAIEHYIKPMMLSQINKEVNSLQMLDKQLEKEFQMLTKQEKKGLLEYMDDAELLISKGYTKEEAYGQVVKLCEKKKLFSFAMSLNIKGGIATEDEAKEKAAAQYHEEGQFEDEAYLHKASGKLGGEDAYLNAAIEYDLVGNPVLAEKMRLISMTEAERAKTETERAKMMSTLREEETEKSE